MKNQGPNRKYPANKGDKFGYWTVVKEVESTYTGGCVRRYVECECRCGSRKVLFLGNLVRGLSTSCGCRRIEVSSKLNLSHGKSKSRLYKLWSGMLIRARGKASHYSYSDRGIGVCERWLKFENFEADMGNRPNPGMTIERLDNDKDYSPDNCVWADRTVQARNRRNTVFITLWGESRKLSQVTEDYGIPYKRLYAARRGGHDLENFITKHRTK